MMMMMVMMVMMFFSYAKYFTVAIAIDVPMWYVVTVIPRMGRS